MNIAYFGTPIFAANLLEKILSTESMPFKVTLIVTQKDKPVGRKQIITPSPVKELAKKYNIEVIDETIVNNGENISSKEAKNLFNSKLIEILKEKQIDLVLLYAYGEIIPQALLDIPKYGFWNIHPSLLPLYRGASPITYPLVMGDKKTAVSLMKMDALLDHGPIIDQVEISIGEDDTREELENVLTQRAYELFIKNVKDIYSIDLHEQDHDRATFSRMLNKNDGFIPFEILQQAVNSENTDFTSPLLEDYLKRNPIVSKPNLSLAEMIFNLFKGLYPWPGIWTVAKINEHEKRIKITNVSLANGRLSINKLQIEGKNEVDFTTFQQAYNLFKVI